MVKNKKFGQLSKDCLRVCCGGMYDQDLTVYCECASYDDSFDPVERSAWGRGKFPVSGWYFTSLRITSGKGHMSGVTYDDREPTSVMISAQNGIDYYSPV